MNRLFLIVLIYIFFTTFAYANTTYDVIISALKNNTSQEELVNVKNKYKGKKISGTGYISSIREPISTQRVIILSETKDSSGLQDIVNITAPQFLSSLEPNPHWDYIKKLRVGEKVNFEGDLFDIFADTIYIKEEVKINKALDK